MWRRKAWQEQLVEHRRLSLIRNEKEEKKENVSFDWKQREQRDQTLDTSAQKWKLGRDQAPCWQRQRQKFGTRTFWQVLLQHDDVDPVCAPTGWAGCDLKGQLCNKHRIKKYHKRRCRRPLKGINWFLPAADGSFKVIDVNIFRHECSE